MHAVIKTGGKQYIVKPGDIIDIEKISGEPGEEVNFEEVLLVSADGEDVKVGSPVVESARVEGRIVKQKRARR